MKKQFYAVFFFLAIQVSLKAQICDSSTPVFNVDLRGLPNGNWISPSIVRNGFCCGEAHPNVCIQFKSQDATTRRVQCRRAAFAVSHASRLLHALFLVRVGPLHRTLNVQIARWHTGCNLITNGFQDTRND